MKPLYLALDLGAGQGTKVGLFRGTKELQAETVFPIESYGPDFASYSEGLLGWILRLLEDHGLSATDIQATGIATAGILTDEGAFQLIHNLDHFNGHNLRSFFQERLDRPTAIENDANAGALAEWSVLQVELLYWVFGGGWGGAWISRDGRVMYPSVNWSGKDEDLHFSNEPGYAIPLEKLTLESLFTEVQSSYPRFERILAEDLGEGASVGPGGRQDALRAETILSGPGRCRLFRAVVADDDFYERFLDIHETRQMSDPSIAGRHISKLSSMRVEAALNTDRLYGKILAHATRILLRQAQADGLTEGAPICLGGKPSYALPYFGPSAQRLFGRFGLMNYLRPSVIDERGLNANLVGSAVLAALAAGENPAV